MSGATGIQTDRLTIRRIAADDWKSIQTIWTDFSASPLSRYDRPNPLDDESVRARIARWASAADSMEHLFFAVCLDRSVIGYCAFNIRPGGYEIGYCFHSAYHGKGYAAESLTALMNHLQTLGVTRFSAGTALDNRPSVALLKSLGFVLTGTEEVSFYQDENGNDVVFQGGIFQRSTDD